MPIIDMQKRMREVGRIRMGDKQGNRPNKLDKFRLTTPDRKALEAAAAVFGGEIRPWAGQAGQFELYVEAEELNILIAPVPVTQWMELWSAGGCQRRCDGCTEQLTGEACLCPEDHVQRQELANKGKACSMVTRLSVMLPELPSLGTWRLESHGFYAASEIPMSAEILLNSAEKGQYIPATLAIEHRKRVSKGETKAFIVPVIRLRQRLSDYLSIAGQSPKSIGAATPELPQRSPAPLPPVSDLSAHEQRRRKEIEDAANAFLKDHGWLKPEHKNSLTQFKNACAPAGLWWAEVFVMAIDERCDDWPCFTKFATERASTVRAEREEAKSAGEPERNPFEELEKNGQEALI